MGKTYNRKQRQTPGETEEILKENGEIIDKTWENVRGNEGNI